jgi:hypothetical protein
MNEKWEDRHNASSDNLSRWNGLSLSLIEKHTEHR